MDNESAPEAGQTGYLKLPWLLVAGALIVLLGGALAVGLMANRSLREQVALPTPTAARLAAAPTATRAPPTAAASPTPPPATATPIAQPTVTPLATPTPEPALAPTPRPTVDPALADEVSEAYQHYWDIRAEALLELDDSRLSEVMAGDHLAAIEELIDQLRSEGHVIQTKVEHHSDVLEASSMSAKVRDTYISNSVYLDASTHAQISEPTSDQLSEIYEFTRVEGVWKVVSLVRPS